MKLLYYVLVTALKDILYTDYIDIFTCISNLELEIKPVLRIITVNFVFTFFYLVYKIDEIWMTREPGVGNGWILQLQVRALFVKNAVRGYCRGDPNEG